MNRLSIITLLAIFFGNTCTSTSKLAKTGITFNEGDDFIYEVINNDETYNFNINLNGVEDYYISFDWEIPQNDISGTILMTETAIASATDLHNYMKKGYLKLTDKTAVWLSKAVFTDIKDGKIINVGLGKTTEKFKLYDETTYEFGTRWKGKPYNIPVIVMANEDNSKKIWILDDKHNCLIVMMELDFNIRLIDFKAFK